MSVWFGLLLLFGMLEIASLLGMIKNNARFDLLSALILPLMLSFGIGLVAVCRRLARDEKIDMVKFLQCSIDASERPSSFAS